MSSISGYRVMWLFVLFDLPVKSREQRQQYAHFRKEILSRGFTQLQLSVYAKHLPSEQAADSLKTHIVRALPPGGQVRLLLVTDHQFGKMEVYNARIRGRVESAPTQISLF
ncbi:MAG TPA: CRISPR-associated endonuclease Cas2 [Bryobacteraceae bacterium]|nr:CRISPR-associated endonuclease Cas2 [Bryobacteraceae bacterium]HOQ46584.1 CRISPR-associated endonuclease Cas2 [Bryobacteraceae bacterium]HPU73375.1 CRISPR-associated endonuclease Cas2 [Bryobacteraceae bacterium]